MFLLQWASITENVQVKVLEEGSLTEAQQLVVDKTILDSVKLLHIDDVDDHPACIDHEVLDESEYLFLRGLSPRFALREVNLSCTHDVKISQYVG